MALTASFAAIGAAATRPRPVLLWLRVTLGAFEPGREQLCETERAESAKTAEVMKIGVVASMYISMSTCYSSSNGNCAMVTSCARHALLQTTLFDK
jgi:hypothetical protein